MKGKVKTSFTEYPYLKVLNERERERERKKRDRKREGKQEIERES